MQEDLRSLPLESCCEAPPSSSPVPPHSRSQQEHVVTGTEYFHERERELKLLHETECSSHGGPEPSSLERAASSAQHRASSGVRQIAPPPPRHEHDPGLICGLIQLLCPAAARPGRARGAAGARGRGSQSLIRTTL